MSDVPETRGSLLVRLRDAQDEEAWEHFVQLYAPLVYRYARKNQLQDADAADLTQDVLHAVSTSIDRLDYNPERGSFRGWLFTIVHRRLCNFLTRNRGQIHGTGDNHVENLLYEVVAPQENSWEEESANQLFLWAVEQVRVDFSDSTWQAFWQTAIEHKPIADVARQLGLSTGAVYVARTRVQARLKEKMQQAHWD